MAESENVYVKIGERGRLIERTADREIDHANLRANGWVLKGSKNAPSKKLETAGKPVRSGLTEVVPTSLRAFADTADGDPGAQKSTSSASGRPRGVSAGEVADAKSQAAAGA